MAGTLLLCIHLGTLHGSPLVGGDDIEGRSVLLDDAAVDPDHSFAQPPDLTHLVTYEHNGTTALGNLAHFPKAFLLELQIAYGQHLVHQQNFGFELSSHGEGQTHLHARAEMLERRIDEFIHVGERHNLIKFALDLTLAHAKNGPAQENVLATRELGMETCSDLKQAAHSPVNLGKTGCRACDPREDLEQRGLASSIATYQANDLTFLNVEGNVAERPELLAAAMLAASTVPSEKPPGRIHRVRENVTECVVPRALADRIALPEPHTVNHHFMHRLDHVRYGRLHSVEVNQSAKEHHEHHTSGCQEHQVGWPSLPGKRPSETLDDAGHGVQSIKPAPARRNERSRIGDGGGKHPKLDDEGDDVADVAIKSVERREP